MGISKAIQAWLLLACFTLGLAAQARPADSLQEAESLLQKQQYDLAEGRLKVVVASQPENPQAWFDLGFAENHLGKTPDAVAAYKKAVELSPKWFEANLNLGLALAQSSDLAQAANVLRNAVQFKPNSGGEQALSKAWFALGQVLEESDKKAALNAYQKSAELDPKDTEPIVAAGRMLEQSNNLADAEQQYLHAANMGDTAGVEHLIGIYLKQKRLADAETWLKKYVGEHPGHAAAQAQLAKVLAAEGKSSDAISMLESLSKSSPDPAVTRELALLYYDAKQYDAAARVLQPLVQQSGADAELHWEYGEALFHQRKYVEAEPELMKALQQKPDLAEAYGDLAFAAQQNKHYQLTLRALELRAKYLPEVPATYFMRATAYDSLNIRKLAAENYKLFLAASAGKFPDQEFQARHRLLAIEPK
ncbi:MAG TPA: tetratricopeptide repeat protein [Candidatus Angelobacter sp.]|jgi:tetratricopeptide (TPR) repeat protein|nr:tetratricopeptide repeat protein [Candidatus Angelobacter sp.]